MIICPLREAYYYQMASLAHQTCQKKNASVWIKCSKALDKNHPVSQTYFSCLDRSSMTKSFSFSISQVKYDFLYDHYHVCCQESWSSVTHRQAYTTFIMVALFLLPLAAMLFLYTCIGIELWIRKRVGDASVLSTMNHREISKISRWVRQVWWRYLTAIFICRWHFVSVWPCLHSN